MLAHVVCRWENYTQRGWFAKIALVAEQGLEYVIYLLVTATSYNIIYFQLCDTK